MDPYLGKILDDRYELLEVIGSGGMAVVYKAMCHRLNRLVAVKILKQDIGRDAELHRRFLTESQAVAMLSHPNIVSVYDVSSSGDLDYIVMELIDGITLKDYMHQRGQLSWQEALHFGMQIASALEHAHSRNIIHRDIKPQNIMVLKDGSIKVADFGIARMLDSQNTVTRETLGSVHYISPEQAKGGKVDQKTDLYSLGVVFYEMLTGRLPYDGDSAVSIAIAHIGGKCLKPREIQPEIPEGLEQIVMHAMSVKTEERYESATQILEDLEAFRQDQKILFPYTHTAAEELPAATEDTREPEPEQPGRENSKVGIILVTSFIILAFVGIAYFLYSYILKDLFSDTEEVSAPNLVGQYYENLDEEYEKFRVTVDKWVYSESVPYGYVISQNPAAEKTVKEGSTIQITVSQGDQEKFMPRVTDMNQSTAEQTLEAMEFELKVTVERENSSVIPTGQVIRSRPVYGEALHRGEEVILYVSSGVAVEMVTVPGLVGMDIEDALLAIDKAGLQRGTVTLKASEEPMNTVIAQSGAESSQVKPDTVINLTVSKGPDEETEKNEENEKDKNDENEENENTNPGEQTQPDHSEESGLFVDQGNPKPGVYTSRVIEAALPKGVGTVMVSVLCDGMQYGESFVADLSDDYVSIRVYGTGTMTFDVLVNSQRCFHESITFPE